MKKLFVLIISFAISNAWGETTSPSPTPSSSDFTISENTVTTHDNGSEDSKREVFSDEEAPITIQKNLKMISKSNHFTDENTHLSINIKYPQLTGTNLTPQAKSFNKKIEMVVNDEVIQFKKRVALDAVHMKTLPEELRKNSLSIDYDMDVIKPKKQTLISVRLSVEGMQAGRAHPYHLNRVINFDLTSGKTIALNDLFKKNASFLKLLAAYTQKALDSKLKNDNWMVAQGTKPSPNNFKNWNLQSDSLLITFDEYQVAPYTFGAQEVEIPYSELKKVLSDKAPIAGCAGTRCQMG